MLYDKRTGQEYAYLLHFGDWLPREQHFTLSDLPKSKILNIAITYLAEDLCVAADRYLIDLENDVDQAQAKYLAADPHIKLQVFE